MNNEMETRVLTIIAGLKKRGINFVAIDFDLTMSDIHSGRSDWPGTVDDIVVRLHRLKFRVYLYYFHAVLAS